MTTSILRNIETSTHSNILHIQSVSLAYYNMINLTSIHPIRMHPCLNVDVLVLEPSTHHTQFILHTPVQQQLSIRRQLLKSIFPYHSRPCCTIRTYSCVEIAQHHESIMLLHIITNFLQLMIKLLLLINRCILGRCITSHH